MAGSLPKNRTHSQSISAANLHPAHRVTRRKSMSQTPVTNIAAIAAAAKGMSGAPLEGASSSGSSSGPRRSSKPASQFRGPSMAMASSMASSVPAHGAQFGASSYGSATKSEALTDGPTLATMLEQDKANAKSRNRRASEGSRLSKGDVKRSGSELRCEKCGKGYKHSSCLTKHLWEHTPEWQYTSKLLISKHQQVQLLEAASVLVAMNKESDGEHSDRSSPPASGSSDVREDLSSTETTPPPQLDDHAVGSYPHSHFGTRSMKRYSTNSSAYSQSYQSTVFSDNGNGNAHGHFRQWSNVSDRPTTSGTSVAGSYHDDANDHADLAAAVGLLSCSYGTPKTGPVALPADAPPVPPLPAKYFDLNARTLSGSTTVTAQQSSMRNSYRHTSESKDVDMDDDHFADEEDYRYSNARSRSRIDEDDDEIFGRMEE
ncbi:hypothetical protein COCCADRAFT_5938 [Bipolaris zeicola 26-R-13]|uniref:C2H2-type domain-containing protein n=1 Tax=Cochliobolus carbonum (strain 26-R-13) TaxID=930089 RepID=W6Y324_COCC2|nr:uncharacterized protein COCCADRAFT_5938 [Bipolaris zeicola 26-R-13]EUC32338.1 hypothetical protein COCCADRAFT_5938 [Bipolaris zeicola 26-R-13]